MQIDTNMKTKVNCVVCPVCKDEIYSRSRHDFHYCSCGEVAVDGGFEYMRMLYKSVMPEIVVREVDATKDALFQDWNQRLDKFGIIKPLTKTVESSKVKSEIRKRNKKGYVMPEKKKTAKKVAKAKTTKVEKPVETVDEPEKGASVRFRWSL